jgi:hypothetical protein
VYSEGGGDLWFPAVSEGDEIEGSRIDVEALVSGFAVVFEGAASSQGLRRGCAMKSKRTFPGSHSGVVIDYKRSKLSLAKTREGLDHKS